MMPTPAPLSNPGVRFPPPLIFATGLVAGWVIDRLVRQFAFDASPSVAQAYAGYALITAGLGIAVWGAITFRRARTSVLPHRSASRLVEGGPYRFTRNPMYTGFTIAYIGVALRINTAWTLLLLPAVLAVMIRYVIRREEAYLSSVFGTDYTEYCKRVRRWL